VHKFLLFAISSALFFSSCQQLDERTKFVLSYKTLYQQADSISHNPSSRQELIVPFVYDYEGDVAFYGTSVNKIESAECYELIILLTDSSEVKNLNFIEDVEFSLRRDGEKDITLRQIEVNKDIVAIRLNFSVIDGVKEIIEEGEFDLVLNFQSSESSKKDIEFEAYVKFLMDSRKFFI
jgi:hypothetical protein